MGGSRGLFNKLALSNTNVHSLLNNAKNELTPSQIIDDGQGGGSRLRKQQDVDGMAKSLGISSPDILGGEPLYDVVVEEMRRLEENKYPNPPYTYVRKDITIEGVEKKAIYVTYTGKELTVQQLNQMRANALGVREYSIAASILNAMNFSTEFLTSDVNQRKEIQNAIKQVLAKHKSMRDSLLSEDKVKEKVKDKVDPLLCNFVDDLVSEIQKATNSDDQASIVRSIRNSERYFVADYRADVIINETTILSPDEPEEKNREYTVIQADLSYNNMLTHEQRTEFMRVHVEKQEPLWYQRLADWEKVWFKHNVPSTEDSPRWAQFEKMNQSSAMSHIPGIQNVRMNYFLAKNGIEKDFRLLSKNINTGSMDPYDIPEINRPNQVINNAKQVLDNLKIEADNRFNSLWGFGEHKIKIDWSIDTEGKKRTKGKQVKPLIFIQSLLSDTLIKGGADNILAKNQAKAIRSLRPNYENNEIIMGNDPVNILRGVTAESGWASVHIARRWVHTDKLLKYSKNFLSQVIEINKKGVFFTKDQMDSLALIEDARINLQKMRDDKIKPQFGQRNFSAFKVAYSQLLVESMGGMTSSNCKSGKDRTGYKELYCGAMRIYRDKYGVLPKFDDNKENRKKFIDIFVVLFNSMKTQEAAASNTPGSFGLKDTAMMLCLDIVKELGLSYEVSNELSDMNKPTGNGNANRPSNFKGDEAREASEIKAFHQEANKHPKIQEPESKKIDVAYLSNVARERSKTVVDHDNQTVIFQNQEEPEIKKLDQPIAKGIDIDGRTIEPIDGDALARILEVSLQNELPEFGPQKPAEMQPKKKIDNELEVPFTKSINEVVKIMDKTLVALKDYCNQSDAKNIPRALALINEISGIKKDLSHMKTSNPEVDGKKIVGQLHERIRLYSNSLNKNSRTKLKQLFSKNSEFDALMENAKSNLNEFRNDYVKRLTSGKNTSNEKKKTAPSLANNLVSRIKIK